MLYLETLSKQIKTTWNTDAPGLNREVDKGDKTLVNKLSGIIFCPFVWRYKLVNLEAFGSSKRCPYLLHFHIGDFLWGIAMCPHYHDSNLGSGFKCFHSERYLLAWLGFVTAPVYRHLREAEAHTVLSLEKHAPI